MLFLLLQPEKKVRAGEHGYVFGGNDVGAGPVIRSDRRRRPYESSSGIDGHARNRDGKKVMCRGMRGLVNGGDAPIRCSHRRYRDARRAAVVRDLGTAPRLDELEKSYCGRVCM
jgi:hypothetical protein